MTIDTVRQLSLQIAKGLHYLHKNNIVHHQIRPENILITTEKQLKICDFGYSVKLEEGKLTKGFEGNLPYAPP